MSNFEAIRSECKLSIENLEISIRNVIDREFTSIYGGLYFDYTDSQGKRLLKTEIVKDAKERMQNTPERYSRFVDALLLDDIVKIICNPNLYQLYFKQYFTTAYPNGNEEARTFLNRLIAIRNKLYHANPISVHESLQALCYSNDVINSIKHGYKEKNMDKKYNAPTIIKISDSYGNQYAEPQIYRNSTGRGGCDTRKNDFKVSVGDKIILEAEIDPSFVSDSYIINWIFDKKETSIYVENNNKLELLVENKHVRTDFAIYCTVKSNKEWHRCGDVDDSVSIIYEITPIIKKNS